MDRYHYLDLELDAARAAGEEFKVVCAYYGSAMFFAQVLEHGIANALMVVDLIPRTNGK